MNAQQLLGGIGILAGVAIIYNYYQRKRNEIPIYFKKSLAKNYNARTIPPFGIYVKESERNNNSLIEHEKIHWKQYQECGLLKFYLQYAGELKKYGYDKMPMEIEARENEGEYCKENYTDCVRTGQAQTIFNPNFRK